MATRRAPIAVAAILLGSALLALGLLGASGAAAEGFTACPAGTEKLVKFQAGGWEPEDKSVTAVTLISPSESGGSWTSTIPIAAVVVKGGSGEHSLDIISYSPHATSGSFSNAKLLNEGGQVPDISFVEFCTADEETTTTPLAPTTTTTQPPTTTTTLAPTTTTLAPTTTTNAAAVAGVTVTSAPSTSVAPQVQGAVELPRTGGAPGLLSLLGAGLVLSGVSIIAVGRRTLTPSPAPDVN